MNNVNKKLVLGHKNCIDGFMSLFLVWKAFKDTEEFDKWEFLEVQYGDPIPDVEDKDVLILDFSYSPEILKEHFSKANSIKILDHHYTAYADQMRYLSEETLGSKPIGSDEELESAYPLIGKNYFNIKGCCRGDAKICIEKEKSGAGMTLDYIKELFGTNDDWMVIHPELRKLVSLVQRVQDRDLWKFEYADTKSVYELLTSIPRTFESCDQYQKR